MSSVKVSLSGDTDELLRRLNQMGSLDVQGILRSMAEGLRTSTVERFTEEKAPDGTSWKPSIRAKEENGKTLTKTAQLKTSIRSEVSDKGLAVGTNDIRAATHQFGDKRTIRARNKRYLTFKIGGQWHRALSVDVNIPARPFLGISKEDEQDIKDILEEAFEE
ncbi:MAG: phage virion morphogenesis protein [bacterium]|nr:phage virion morphogenesis protein [bacterium]MCM1376126.1 phage virion morphogenesis protein [Muribaculum sp.]